MSVSTDISRPIWLRILQFPLTRLIVLGGIIFYMMAMAEGNLQKFKDTPVQSIVVALTMGLAAMAIYLAWGKFIERRDVFELSLPKLGREWMVGALIGAGLYTSCVVMLMLLGMYQIEGLNPVAYLVPAMAMAAKSGIFEELLFRGVLFRSIEDMAGSWVAIIISSLVFGFLHLLNPEATFAGAAYISIEAGLLLAAAYLVTRRLWIAIGFHMMWNYVQSAVFSGIVSGGVTDPGLFQDKIEGPSFITGGNFGMEQSIFALIFCTTAGVVLLIIAKRQGHMVPPPWRRKG